MGIASHMPASRVDVRARHALLVWVPMTGRCLSHVEPTEAGARQSSVKLKAENVD